MEGVKLVEKVVIVPEKPTNRRRIFLSNLDLPLVAYQESVSFYDPPEKKISFSESYNTLFRALRSLLVPYDFFAGRLVPALEDNRRLEIDCNGAGVVVAAARTGASLSQLGGLFAPKPNFKQLVAFLSEEGEDEMEFKDKPLLYLQFGCGSLALASRYNHCVLDGAAARDFEKNLAAFTRGDDLVIVPNPDRTILRARNPPRISHPHHEYSKPSETRDNSGGGTRCINAMHSTPHNKTHLIYIPPLRIDSLKMEALKDGNLKKCTTFHAIAAKVWKARSIATKMHDEICSTMLFPVDVRRILVPPVPIGFAGNALVPGFARASVRELKDKEDSYLVRKVQEGVERFDDEYVRSGLDWLEVHRGVPCKENSFSLVAWFRLGLEEDVFSWGKLKYATPVVLKPGLVFLLPGLEGDGGLNICLDLPDDQVDEFHRLLME
ncbi:hypothetical protein SADUNF_Sadunf02G0193700 [Salix dunnii]|uniref:Uncharacterized protein n=1 Tax=Salix dunnii TaxID=1413687 RepID=A0A835N8T2_9ROSI|nr:hypothetical protein SADUNF_Sadunf02G0193700 [Salix dunnii]